MYEFIYYIVNLASFFFHSGDRDLFYRTRGETEPTNPPINFASLLGPVGLPSLNHNNTEEPLRRSFSKRSRFTGRTKVYTVEELQLATNCFNEANVLGEGSLGPVYRAKFPDGKVESQAIFQILIFFITFRFQTVAFKLYDIFFLWFFVEDFGREEDKHGGHVLQRRGKVLGYYWHDFQTEAPQHSSTQWLLFGAWKASSCLRLR